MKNFYQSDIRKTINQEVYNKPVFDFDFLGEKYFGVVKEHKKLGVNIRWYQVLGLDISYYLRNYIPVLKKEFEKIKKDYTTDFGNMFFQFGFIDRLAEFAPKELRNDEFVQSIKQKREEKSDMMLKEFGLRKSIRENMPLATVKIDLSLGSEHIRDNMAKSARNHIKKAVSNGLYFEMAKEKDWKDFYDIWYGTSSDKGFNIIPKKVFYALKDYILSSGNGNLFLAKKNDEIVSGSICLFVDNDIIYLYGATNRNFGNVGGHHFLKFEMFKWGVHNGYDWADLLGVAPSGYPEHHLVGVSSFKQSLGGKKIEYLGNFDLVLNPVLYNTAKLLRGE